MEISEAGLTIWYGTADAPAPPDHAPPDTPVRLTVGVRPASAANGVNVAYRVNGGAECTFHAALVRTDYVQNRQLFVAEFPPISPGSSVEYSPIIRQAGRRIDFRRGNRYPSSFSVLKRKPLSAAVPANRWDLYRYNLDPLARVEVDLVSQPVVIGDTPEGFHINMTWGSGRYRGKINAEIQHSGGDWLLIRPDGVGIPDIKATITTDDGANILMEATGRLDFGGDGYSKGRAGSLPDHAPLVLASQYLSSGTRYDWLQRLQCLGIGYVNLVDYKVHYDLYGVRSLAG